MDTFQPQDLAWIILLLPLTAAAVIVLFTRGNARLSAQLSVAAVVLGFLLSAGVMGMLWSSLRQLPHLNASSLPWLNVGPLQIELGLRLDPLSLLMLLVVTGVGGVIHIYSLGYMKEDHGFARFFASLSLFTFAMLGIVLANNLVMMFIFWELVGVSSYLLIGFWYEKPSAADACKKAFITNRLGDFGFVLGILLVWSVLGSLKFEELQAKIAQAPEAWGGVAALAGVLIFCGAMGKSAQFPLHVWLPDAMEGPTPVSALIHAATMVAAGVYMLCRVFFLFGTQSIWPQPLSFLNGWSALDIIAWIGGITALLAALIAVQQDDIKRILAYSTLSQLGYMVMAVGLSDPSGPTPAMYHLVTHAFFKALLFLGAGSVILACHHEQNIWRMGGLKSRMPWTYRTFLLGTLALCGVPPFSGFFSKDEILGRASQANVLLFILGVFTAALTTFYMTRLVVVAFMGPARSDAASHAQESPGVMVWPLILLAVPTLLAGFWGIDRFIERQFHPGEAAVSRSGWETFLEPFGHAPLAAFLGLGAVGFGFSFAWSVYAGTSADPLPNKLRFLSRWMREGFGFDLLYERLIAITHEAWAQFANAVDRWIITGLGVGGISGVIEIAGRGLRLFQTGNVQTYAFLVTAGIALVLLFVLK